MSLLDDQYDFRDEIVESLRRDLVGPSDGVEEVLDELPLDRYIIGVLWPASENERTQEEVGDEPANAADNETGSTEDSPVAQARMRYPSSCGLTFSVDLSVTSTVTFVISAARYVPGESVLAAEPVTDTGRSRSRLKASAGTWSRVAAQTQPIHQDVSTPGTIRHQVATGLELYVLVREQRDEMTTVTGVLRNTQTAEPGERDGHSWFQVGLEAITDGPGLADRSRKHASGDPDLASGALLYRNVHTFGIGHGCAVTWAGGTAVNGRVDRVATTWIPTAELNRAKPDRPNDDIDLTMSSLAGSDITAVAGTLDRLVAEYREWIGGRESELQNLPAELISVGRRHLDDANAAADRIQAGVDLLRQDALSFKAFQLANTAMMTQRARQDWIRAGAKGAIDPGETQSWRPFQIAFILLNLPGLADGSHTDRDTADLLWFPTGGGKTEAYLGLIAFTILRRRLVDSAASGVAVIMRYTLRLLTIQQFERATMLMCSLEQIRFSDGSLGTEPFSIGLWVGAGATPNTLDQARTALNKLKRGQPVEEGNPIQLTRCPWCNTVLDPDHYIIRRQPEPHLSIACRTADCAFSQGLPVHLVDEDVYRERPELLLGTVDKFAMMAWNERVGTLFGRDGQSSRPDLIIQDELHLISGPLGSVVGLYETAVDAACTIPVGSALAGGSRPKIIASTATIRRATNQVRAIFDRSVAQFPPPGLDPDRSFFASPASRNEAGTRQYVGVMAPGTSHATLLVRVYAALLQAAQDIPTDSNEVKDPYWTLMGYFNSLRVLGGAYLQVVDDVRARLNVIAKRNSAAARKVREPSELTSRVPSSEIPGRLKNLEAGVSERNKVDDVVLATNMISVGLDVDRLGLMAVMGQPQSSAEYIQATSRVGRKHPGLVVTMFNAARSRDRSHYENFLPFHQSMYRSVEATSATPFAARARDRALHGVLVSMVRLLVPALSSDGAAYQVGNREAEVQAVAAAIVRRVASAEPDEELPTAEQLEALIDLWINEGDARPNMRYRNISNPDAALLVKTSTALVSEDIDFGTEMVPWPTLESMRDVDAESGLYQIPARKRS